MGGVRDIVPTPVYLTSKTLLVFRRTTHREQRYALSALGYVALAWIKSHFDSQLITASRSSPLPNNSIPE